jgi:hypothetical protein
MPYRIKLTKQFLFCLIFLYPSQSLNTLLVSKYLAIVIDWFLFACFLFFIFSCVFMVSFPISLPPCLRRNICRCVTDLFHRPWLSWFIFIFSVDFFSLHLFFYFIPIPLFFEIFTLYWDLFVFSTVTVIFCCLVSIVTF